jgi:hypothetical protein
MARIVSGQVWAFDIECAEWDKLVVGRAVCSDGTVEKLDTYADIREWYFTLPGDDLILSHVGGRYDFLALLEACGDRGEWRGTCAGSSLISLRARGFAECRDTFAIVPQSLARWSGVKDSTGLDCICGDDCGGYCSISLDMPASLKRRLAEYCVQDCRALLSAWDALLDYADMRDIPLCYKKGGARRTVGAVAWALASEYAEKEPYTWGRYDLERSAYYGGRCEVFRPEAPRLERYDLNAAYPWALTLPVPVGEPRPVAGGSAVSAWKAGEPGLYRVDWTTGNDWIPPLPRRGAGRLVWAAGSGSGWYARPELEAAEQSGATLDVTLGLLYDEKPIYRELMSRLFDLRARARRRWGREDWRVEWVKRISNTISGKLAQGTGACTIHVTDSPRLGWRWLGGRAWAETAQRISSCARPAQAAYLTARVRARLLHALSTAEPAYCDTDSCYSAKGAPDIIGDGLGEWGHEGPAFRWRAPAPKVYRYHTGKKLKVKGKGFSGLTDAGFDTILDGKPWVIDRGVVGIRTAGTSFERKHVERRLRLKPGFVGFRRISTDGRALAPTIRGDRVEWRGKLHPAVGDAIAGILRAS